MTEDQLIDHAIQSIDKERYAYLRRLFYEDVQFEANADEHLLDIPEGYRDCLREEIIHAVYCLLQPTMWDPEDFDGWEELDWDSCGDSDDELPGGEWVKVQP